MKTGWTHRKNSILYPVENKKVTVKFMTGSTILHYKITEKLGEGGMGVVYKAVDTELDRTVALKFLPRHIAANQESIDRFKTEAKAAAALNHPNITTIYSIAKNEERDGESQLFLVMEFIDGIELKEKINIKKIPYEEAVDISIKICRGLEAAHNKGIVHRDIKSSNIMITHDGAVKIMDFGLAKLGNAGNLTRMGTTLGTISYMSPEQTAGENVDQQTDIWSLGVVMYELFTGNLPFRGDYDQAVVYSILNENPRRLKFYDESIPEPVEAIIFKALAKNKEERYSSVTELLNDLELLREVSGKSSIPTSRHFSFITGTPPVKKANLLKSPWLRWGAVAILLIATALLLYDYISRSDVSPGISGNLIPAEKHIAVLPFNIIGGTENKSLADGLSEIITSKLSQLEQYKEKLWIVPVSEMQKSNVTTPEDAFNAFGINLAVTGSLQRIKNKWQLILNLVDPAQKRQISSRVIDEPLTEISTIQDEAVLKTAEMLDLRIEDVIKNRLRDGETSNLAANELYLEARGNLLNFSNVEGMKKTIVLMQKAVEVDSGFALAYAGLGDAYLRLYSKTKDISLVEKAKLNCLKADSLNKNLAQVHITLGKLYTETGKYEEANKEFLVAQDIEPSNVDAYQGQAAAYNKQGKLDEAESIYKKVIKMKPDYWAGYNHLGVFYYLHGDYKNAARQFEQVIKMTPLNATAYRNLGSMYYYLDQKADAVVMFKRSLEIQPDYTVYSNLATLYYYEGMYSDAASTYEKALKMQDSDYSVWGYLAGAYRQSSADSSKITLALQKAKALAEEQLKVNPVDPQVLTNIASYCTELNLADSARSIIKKVVSLDPKDVNVMILVSEVFEQLGERDNALNWVRKALKNGYAVEELDHIPELKKLRADNRFKQILLTNK